MSFIGKRYAEANNMYMKNFDETKESTYLMYFDANSLYSWAMCNDLPVGGFKWVQTEDKNEFMNRKIEEKNYNVFVECDITYPEELHDLHNDYPLAPERMVIDNKFKKSTYLESIITKIKKEYDVKLNKSKASKLVSTLSNKTSYVVHAKLFMQYKHLGLKMNVTKILSFKAKPWMKDFITFNIDKRKEAKNAIEVIFFQTNE